MGFEQTPSGNRYELNVWNDVDDLAATTLTKLDTAVRKRKQRVVFANAHVVAWVHFCAALTNQNCSCCDLRAVKYFDAESLRVRIATVAG